MKREKMIDITNKLKDQELHIIYDNMVGDIEYFKMFRSRKELTMDLINYYMASSNKQTLTSYKTWLTFMSTY